MSQTGSAGAATSADTTLADVEKLIGVVGAVAEAIVPGSTTIAGFTIDEVASIAEGVANAVPAVVSAYEEIKAAVSGGTAPTADQLAALKAAVDAADDKLQADVKAADAADAAADQSQAQT